MAFYPAPAEHRHSDAAVIELLRVENMLGVSELATRMGVTATAVRQRLDRLMQAGLVGRITLPAKLRGRPSHSYSLTEKGQRTGGDNFRDLAMVLWRELRDIRDPAVRQGLITRIGAAMASMYRDDVAGETPRERLESASQILRNRGISCGIEQSQPDEAPVLASYACPYPELAKQDRGICAAERVMFQELVGTPVQLSECHLDGQACCRFTLRTAPAALSAAAGPCLEPD